jgi:hypothetical protein
MLEWAGIKRLAVASGATSLSLFGKIYGRQKDYWIV